MAVTPDETPGSYIGARLRRPDGPPKVTGEAQYAADLSLPGMLYVRTPTPESSGWSGRPRSTCRAWWPS